MPRPPRLHNHNRSPNQREGADTHRRIPSGTRHLDTLSSHLQALRVRAPACVNDHSTSVHDLTSSQAGPRLLSIIAHYHHASRIPPPSNPTSLNHPRESKTVHRFTLVHYPSHPTPLTLSVHAPTRCSCRTPLVC
jgi:hypothetical protein